METFIRFRPKSIIKRVVDGKTMNAFVTSGEYDGELLKGGGLQAYSTACKKSYILKRTDVIIVQRGE